ncbi:hypothetical protein EDD18DRAFT_1151207 [Armillaria luteobubalina]|uniref:MYND-type domain-containing protein n=1 Tax=Armillaria luteobubalina TaxID=153913 RepID=A0AA39UVM8_9AGAR|nr:hypothetical protein EDD18DRAFT_1151207 [Armillaria luteobubalina]
MDQPLVVHLPPERLDQCSHCSVKKPNLSFCSACAEATYCSTECQKLHWEKEHKQACGKTDRIDIGSFYPLLAILAETARFNGLRPTHPALTHRISASPAIVGFPDGSAAKVIELGPEEIPMHDMMSARWWPAAAGGTDRARRKLFARLVKEGEVLPIVTSLCLGLLATMYTTTSSRGSRSRRVRLQYKSSPISDFGIAKGSFEVKCQDQLAYFNGNTFWKGQDPNDHYWIYFKTVRGEEIILDIGLFTFNFCTMVSAAPYISDLSDFPPGLEFAPAFFRDREIAKNVIQTYTERKRVSVLRNEKLGRAIRHSGDRFEEAECKLIWDFLDDFGEGTAPSPDEGLPIVYTLKNLNVLREVLEKRTWTKWPKEPPLGIDSDPHEKDYSSVAEDDAWFKNLKKWTKKYKSGKVSRATYDSAIRKMSK